MGGGRRHRAGSAAASLAAVDLLTGGAAGAQERPAGALPAAGVEVTAPSPSRGPLRGRSPRHRVRFDSECRPAVPPWTVGGSVTVDPGQRPCGGEANPLEPTGICPSANLRPSPRAGPEAEPCGIVRDLFDKRHAASGTPFDLAAAEPLGPCLSDLRTVSPGDPPRAIIGGVLRVVP